jgi:putative FmdB family regulatory protein
MIMYDFKCQQGHRFEALLTSSTVDDPPCDDCGSPSRRVPSAIRLSGRASAGTSREQMPRSWQGINNGDAETVRHWHTQMAQREKLEEKYPELGGDRRPVLAHEGIFASKPLRLGDDIPSAVADAMTSDRTGPATQTHPQK